MSNVKLPEPFRKQGQKIAFDGCDCAQADYFVSAQLKQYGDDRAREALEMAAKLRQELHDVRFLYQRLCDHIQSDCL